VRRRVDARALAALRSRHVEGLPPLRALSWASFVAWFVVLPASLAPQLPVRPAPLAAMALVVVLWLASVAASVRLLHGCGVRGRPLWGALLPLLLFPPASAHAASLVTRELYLGYEPEALASQLLAPAALEAYRRECEPPDSSDRTWEVAAIARQLVTRGRRPPANVPARRDASAVSFCPRCHGEYRAGFARCSDCGVTLARYGP
jgi:hypothetical protein